MKIKKTKNFRKNSEGVPTLTIGDGTTLIASGVSQTESGPVGSLNFFEMAEGDSEALLETVKGDEVLERATPILSIESQNPKTFERIKLATQFAASGLEPRSPDQIREEIARLEVDLMVAQLIESVTKGLFGE